MSVFLTTAAAAAAAAAPDAGAGGLPQFDLAKWPGQMVWMLIIFGVMLFLGFAVTEAMGIFALVMAFIILFVKV